MTARFDLAAAPLGPGTIVLEASAGTGKTYSLTGILLRLLLERTVQRLDQVLVVTFTIAATEELKNRVRAALNRALRATREPEADPFFRALATRPDAESLLRAALDDFDQVAIATIHGFCKRLLDESAFESCEPFAREFLADPTPYLRRAAADALRSLYTPGPSVQGALLDAGRFTPAVLIAAHSLWKRYPDVALDPAAPDLADSVGAVREALDAAVATFDDAALALVERLPWLAGQAPAKDRARYSPARVQKRARAEPLLTVEDLCALAPSRFAAKLKKKGCPPLDHPFFAACDALAAGVDDALLHLRSELLLRMDERLQAEKREHHVLDFHDLIARTHGALFDPQRGPTMLAAIRRRYGAALIDEFQDTDRLQYEIFATCFRDRPLFLIGDPKQSIYGFRGADLRVYGRALSGADDRFTLGTNYRSNEALVAAVQRTCARPGAFADAAIALPEVDADAPPEALGIDGEDLAPLQWRFVGPGEADPPGRYLDRRSSEARIAADVAGEISRLLRSGLRCDGEPMAPRHVAVLCRSHYQTALVQDRLRAAGIAATIGNTGDVFDTDEVDELERLMLAILRPGDLQACRAAMATRIYGLDAGAIAALDADEVRFDAEVERLHGWRQTWGRAGFAAMKEQLFADLGVEARVLAVRGGERRLTNIRQLTELLHRAEHDAHLAPDGLLDWLRSTRQSRDLGDPRLRELRLETDADAVQLMTVHASKGLQFEVVFCPFLWGWREIKDQVVVTRGEDRALVFELDGEHPDRDAAETTQLAEDARLCYVALTRARRRCYVHIGPIAPTWQSALAWLLAPGSAGTPTGAALTLWRQELRESPTRIGEIVDRLVADSGGTMARVDVPPDPVPQPVPAAATARLQPPRRALHVPPVRSLASFSSLVAGAEADHGGRDVGDPAREVTPAATPAGIFAFARGAAAGSCLHAILEQHDWGPAAAPLQRLTRSALQAAGLLDPRAHAAEIDPVAAVIDTVRALERARVHLDGPTWRELCAGPRAVEWQFTLPTRGADLAELADLFRTSDSPVARRHAERLGALGPRMLQGFLTGFVDLVAEHDGRHWIVDWKSNHLGDAPESYSSAAVAEAMHAHDYVLQYHLYVLALHRQLRQRLADYDYDRHVGGVGYAFLRGAVPGTANGMFHDRPPRALVEAMDAWASGERSGGHR